MIRLSLALAVLAAVLAPAALADPVQVRSDILRESVIKTANGPVTVIAPADRATPGDTIIVRLTYANDGAKPASDVVIVNPLPHELAFVELREGGGAMVSVDGGRTFGALASLTVVEGGVKRPARAEDVTHVRWRLAEPVAPGQSGEVAFAAHLK